MRFSLFLLALVVGTACQPGDEEGGDETSGAKVKENSAAIDWSGRSIRAGQEKVYGWGLDKISPALRISERDRKSPARTRPSFLAWKKKQGRVYHNTSDMELHARIFEQKEKMVAENLAAYAEGLVSYYLGINKFADFTEEEYSKFLMNNDAREAYEKNFKDTNITHVYNHSRVKRSIFRTTDYRFMLPPVKDQGSCGSCYAFSAMATLEALYYKQFKQVAKFSESLAVDCTWGGKYGNQGCGGGWMWAIFKWLKDSGGHYDLSILDEHPKAGKCREADLTRTFFTNNGYVMINKGDENAIFGVLNQYSQPVAIAYNAGTQQHAAYRGGILDVPNCGNTPTHAVAIVGSGTENGKEYFLARNSWGGVWGEKGYFRIRKGVNMCGIADWASYPVFR